LFFILFFPGLQVKNITVLGNEKINTQELQSIVLSNSNTSLVEFWNFKIISKSILLVNTNNISKEILKKFPAIEKIKLDKNFPQTLELRITERKPIGIYCTNNNQCFLIDQNGIIFSALGGPASGWEGQENLTIVRQRFENNDVYIGESVVSRNTIDAFNKIQKDIKDNLQINLKEALITSPIRINIITKENWQIYFDLSPDSDINLQITKLNLLLDKKNNSINRDKLRYINLIPKDRAIICDNSVCGGQ